MTWICEWQTYQPHVLSFPHKSVFQNIIVNLSKKKITLNFTIHHVLKQIMRSSSVFHFEVNLLGETGRWARKACRGNRLMGLKPWKLHKGINSWLLWGDVSLEIRSKSKISFNQKVTNCQVIHQASLAYTLICIVRKEKRVKLSTIKIHHRNKPMNFVSPSLSCTS